MYPGRHFRISQGRQFVTSRDGQIGSLGHVLGTLERDVLGTSWGLIFTDWVESIKGFFPKKFRNIEIKNEIDEIKK